MATAETYVAFEGATAWGDRSKIPFRVTSTNWQESDRLLAGIMTAFGASTMAIPIDGVGRFDGVMLGAFSRPRIEGRFVGDKLHAWGVTWGAWTPTSSSRTATPTSAALCCATASRKSTSPASSRSAIRARMAARKLTPACASPTARWPTSSGRSISRTTTSKAWCPATSTCTVEYTQPFGFGRLAIRQGTAYGEPFAEGEAALRFEGAGVRLDGLTVLKGGTTVTGAAYIGWNGAYSFNADGRGMAVETLAVAAMSSGPGFTGLFDFSANGSGTFNQPRYDVKFGVRDLFYGDEGVGEVSGRMSVQGTVLVYEMEVASTRLAASGTGRIALTDEMDAELSFRITDTSLDPYVRAFQPQLSPFTSAVASGTIRVVGELYNPDALRVDVDVEDVALRFFDYELKNAGNIRMSVDRQVLQVDALRLVGEDTELDLAGTVDVPKQALALTANGAANLAVLQGFAPDVRSSGRAEVAARRDGHGRGASGFRHGAPLRRAPPPLRCAARARSAERHRHVHGDGRAAGRAQRPAGGGPVRFAGRVGLNGYTLSDYDVSATGTDMRLRSPKGCARSWTRTSRCAGPARRWY